MIGREGPARRGAAGRTGTTVMLRLTMVVVVALLLGAGPMRVAGAADEMALWRTADGPHLRGANVYQRRVYPELDGPDWMGPGPLGPPYAAQDFADLRRLGANVVVLSHPGPFTEAPPYRPDPDVVANLDRLVGLAAAADLFVVIAVRTGPGRSEFTFFHGQEGTWFDAGYVNETVWSDRATQDGWVAMWRYLAERYRDIPAVVGYDLMVEPNANATVFDEYDPATFYAAHGGSLADWNTLFPRLIAAIRAADPDTPILLSPMSHAAIAWLPWLADPGDDRVVIAVHQYDPFDFTHMDPGGQARYPGRADFDWDGVADPFDRTSVRRLLDPLDTARRAVAVTEFGAARWAPGASGFLDDEMTAFEALGANHMIWMWHPRFQERFGDSAQFDFRLGQDPGTTRSAMPNALSDVLAAHWHRNTVTPSTPVLPPGKPMPGQR